MNKLYKFLSALNCNISITIVTKINMNFALIIRVNSICHYIKMELRSNARLICCLKICVLIKNPYFNTRRNHNLFTSRNNKFHISKNILIIFIFFNNWLIKNLIVCILNNHILKELLIIEWYKEISTSIMAICSPRNCYITNTCKLNSIIITHNYFT